jgi:hypothetical protein
LLRFLESGFQNVGFILLIGRKKGIVTVLSKLVCYSIAFIDLDVCIYIRILHSLELITTSEWALVTATNCIDLGQATCLLCFVKTKKFVFYYLFTFKLM